VARDDGGQGGDGGVTPGRRERGHHGRETHRFLSFRRKEVVFVFLVF